MSSAATDSTNDVSGEVLLGRAVVFAMPNFPAILTNLVFIITKSTIQRGQFTKLIALVIVLPFGGGSRLEKNVDEK